MTTTRPRRVWAALVVTVVTFDVWCAYNAVEGDSLSEVTRHTLRTDTTFGRAAFLTMWVALSGWFIPHIIRKRDPA